MDIINIFNFDGSNPPILIKEKIGKCQRYSEYEIKPIPTRILVDKILVITPSSEANQIIKAVPPTGKRDK